MSAYLLAKIRGKLSRMVEDDDVEKLATADLDMIHQRLSTSSYAPFLEQTKEGTVRISDRLRQGLFADVSTLLPTLTGRDRELLTAVLARYRVENLKTIIRAYVRHIPSDTAKRNVFSLPWERVDYAHLLSLPGIDALVQEIPWPAYQRALATVHRQVGDKATTFPYEAELDSLYLERLISQRTRHPAEVKRILKNRILWELFSWAFRLKEYGFSFPESVNLLPDFRALVPQEEMRHIIEDADGWHGIAHFLGESGKEFEQVDSLDLGRLEKLFDAQLIRLVRTAFVTAQFGIGIVVGYIYLKELELARLVTLVELARERG